MSHGTPGRLIATIILLVCLGLGVAFAGAAGGGGTTNNPPPNVPTTTNPPSTTNPTTTSPTVTSPTVTSPPTTTTGSSTATSGTSAVVTSTATVSTQSAFLQSATTGGVLSQLASYVSANAQPACNYLQNAVNSLPSNTELVTASAPVANNLTYYDTSSSTTAAPVTDPTSSASTVGTTSGANPGQNVQYLNPPTGSDTAFAVPTTSGTVALSPTAPTTGIAYQLSTQTCVSPIVLDIRGYGRLEASDGNYLPHPRTMHKNRLVAFDINANGFEDVMEWVGPNDGLLVEPKANGEVDGSCLFGTTGGWISGYEKLSLRDANHDGKLTGDELKGLYVWIDRNGDGRIDDGELQSLQSLRITELNLNHTNYRSTFVMNGGTRLMWDWWPSALRMRKVRIADL